MAEQLLLRKGSLAKLADQKIIAGAISITTDVPGIYLDVDDETRIRIGDFIAVDNLNALNDIAMNQGLVETVLYYAQDENVLARYSSAIKQADGSTKPGLVWINDTTAIDSKIAAIDSKIAAINTYIDDTLKPKLTSIDLAIKAIQDTLGSATTGHKATHTLDDQGNATATVKTVYKSIEDEYDRAIGAEGALQSQIDTLKGAGTGSLGALEQKLNQEITDRTTADTNVNNTINRIYGATIPTEGEIDTITKNATAISAIKTEIGASTDNENKDTIYGAIAAERVRAQGAEQGIEQKITDLKAGSSSTIKSLDEEIAGLKQADTDNNNTVSGINNRLTQAEADIDGLEASVGYVKPEGGKSLKTLLDEEITRATGVENTLQGSINTLRDTVAGNKTAAENLVKTEKERAEKEEAAIRKEFADADAKIRKDFADADAALLEEINNNIVAANSMTFKGSILYNNAGTDLDWPLSGVKAGDTYVVYVSNKAGTHTYHAGDLIVAKYDQDKLENVTTYPTGIGENGGWIHVETGYNAATQSTLSAQENKVVLTSHAGVSLGEVEITTESPNLEITTSGTSAIQVNLVWSNFT